MSLARRMKYVAGGLVLIGGLLLVVRSLARDGESSVANTPVNSDALELEPPSKAKPLGSPQGGTIQLEPGETAPIEPTATAARATPDEARVPITPAAFSGIVTNKDGQPIQGARLSWTAYSSELLETSKHLSLTHWAIDNESFERNTVWTDSNSAGRFSFATPPTPSETATSVVWATHLDHVATPVLLDADSEQWPIGKKLTMNSSSPITVRVVGGAGQDIHGASIDEFAIVPSTKALLTPLEPGELVRMYLRRSFKADEKGQAQVPTFPGELHLQAYTDISISKARVGLATPNVELALLPSFTAEGRLTLTDGGTAYPFELSVVAQGWKGGFGRPVGNALFDDEALTWGPVQIPISGEDRFSFALQATTIVPQRHFIATPETGERIVIDFESMVGHEVWFALDDENGEPLNKGLIELSWEEPNDHGTLALKLRADGNALCRACPPGRMAMIRGSAPGYVSRAVGGFFEVPEETLSVHVIALPRAAGLTGRVLSEGLPVSDFEIVAWLAESPRQVLRKKFIDAEDGSFTLDEAPLGNVLVIASSDRFSPSMPQNVVVVKSETPHVVLELQRPQSGGGQVLDETGTPLSNAQVQLVYEDDRVLIADRGLPIDVDRQGRFRLESIPAGRLAYRVSAPGYSPREEWAEVRAGRTLELGAIRLSPLRDLEVRFLFPPEVDATQYMAGIIMRGVELGRKRLDSQGICRFKEVGVSTDVVRLFNPDRSSYGLSLSPPSSRNWVVEYPMLETGRIVITVGSARQRETSSGLTRVSLDSYGTGMNSFVLAQQLSNGTNGVLTFHQVRPGNYLAKVTETGFSAIGSVLVAVVAGQTTHATITFDNKDSIFRIVDGRGDALSGVALSAYATDYPLWRQVTSDAEGLCTISGSPAMGAFLGLQRADLGDLWGIPIELGKGDQEIIELEFVAEHAVRLQILDGETPLEGVTCRLNASANRNVGVAFPRESAPGGHIEFENLGLAVYGVDLSGPGIWGKKIEVKASEGTKATTVQVRRLGDLHFRVTGAAGQPLAGVGIELTSLEFDTSAEAWIQQGMLRTAPPSTRTDSEGVLIFPGIPRGKYRWRTSTHSGDPLEGLVELLPADKVVVPIALQ